MADEVGGVYLVVYPAQPVGNSMFALWRRMMPVYVNRLDSLPVKQGVTSSSLPRELRIPAKPVIGYLLILSDSV